MYKLWICKNKRSFKRLLKRKKRKLRMKTLILMKWRKSEIYKTEIKKKKVFYSKTKYKKNQIKFKANSKT